MTNIFCHPESLNDGPEFSHRDVLELREYFWLRESYDIQGMEPVLTTCKVNVLLAILLLCARKMMFLFPKPLNLLALVTMLLLPQMFISHYPNVNPFSRHPMLFFAVQPIPGGSVGTAKGTSSYSAIYPLLTIQGHTEQCGTSILFCRDMPWLPLV